MLSIWTGDLQIWLWEALFLRIPPHTLLYFPLSWSWISKHAFPFNRSQLLGWNCLHTVLCRSTLNLALLASRCTVPPAWARGWHISSLDSHTWSASLICRWSWNIAVCRGAFPSLIYQFASRLRGCQQALKLKTLTRSSSISSTLALVSSAIHGLALSSRTTAATTILWTDLVKVIKVKWQVV